MHAYGRTLRQVGDVRLLAFSVDGEDDRYCVTDGSETVAAYPTLEQGLAAFEAVCRAFAALDDPMGWGAGRTDGRLARCAVLALEAVRLMNAGFPSADGARSALLVPRLLRRAAEEYERAVRAAQDRE